MGETDLAEIWDEALRRMRACFDFATGANSTAGNGSSTERESDAASCIARERDEAATIAETAPGADLGLAPAR